MPWWQAALFALLATFLLAFWSYYVRTAVTQASLRWAALAAWKFEPYVIGAAAWEVAGPLVLLLVWSRTKLFRRAVTGVLTPPERYQVIGVLILIQLLFNLYQWGLIQAIEDHVTLGLFVVLVAGLLGGWQIGLSVGGVALFAIGLFEYLHWDYKPPFDLHTYLEWHVQKNMAAVSALWVGLVVGLWSSRRQPQHRLQPLAAFGGALLVELIVTAATFHSLEDPTWLMVRFLPNAVISALALVAFALMARSVQEEAAREQAEATRLALAETDLTLAQTKLALAQAEVRALHAQINPHFFFNSLNTIRYFIRTDPNTARDLLNKLSEIFQRVLSAGDRVPLRDEISHVEAYLSLEKARLDERLRVVWTNLAKNSQDQPVPTLILQPLVENAVIHGISPKEEGGTVHIVLTEVGGDLLIQVEDDGVGFDPAQPVKPEPPHRAASAIGLRNVDERLRMLYGEAYRLVIDSQPDRGTRVVLRIPINALHADEADSPRFLSGSISA